MKTRFLFCSSHSDSTLSIFNYWKAMLLECCLRFWINIQKSSKLWSLLLPCFPASWLFRSIQDICIYVQLIKYNPFSPIIMSHTHTLTYCPINSLSIYRVFQTVVALANNLKMNKKINKFKLINRQTKIQIQNKYNSKTLFEQYSFGILTVDFMIEGRAQW